MKEIVVLGCGLVGAVIARDLAAQSDLEVVVLDSSTEALLRFKEEIPVRVREADLSRASEIAEAVREADVVVGALPGRLGFRMLEAVIDAGRPIADISFAPEDSLALDPLARKRGVTAVVDCGVSPGLSNFAVGRAAAAFEEIEDVRIFVGGLPFERRGLYEYAIVFSPSDVIEEYTRPARVIENGRVVTRPALSDVESLEIPGVGRVEAFLTDGLRTLLATVPARNMSEKTLRYPGHAERMGMLRDSGFFGVQPILVGQARVSPRAVTERLLAQACTLRKGEEEFTFLRVLVTGRRAGHRARFTFELFDRTDRVTGMTSMARTTGFPCAVVAAMLARGEYRDCGIRPLELLARDPEAAERLQTGLRERGLRWKETIN